LLQRRFLMLGSKRTNGKLLWSTSPSYYSEFTKNAAIMVKENWQSWLKGYWAGGFPPLKSTKYWILWGLSVGGAGGGTGWRQKHVLEYCTQFPLQCPHYSTSVIDICLSLQNFVVFAPPAKAFLLIWLWSKTLWQVCEVVGLGMRLLPTWPVKISHIWYSCQKWTPITILQCRKNKSNYSVWPSPLHFRPSGI